VQPLVSVITPTYNRAGYLEKTLDSVLAQDHPLEHLVLDDGSTDDTPALLARYGSRVRALRHDNVGQVRTVNRGFELAQGELLMVVNSDDPLRPGAVRRLVQALQAAPDAVLVYSDYDRIDEAGQVLGPGLALDGGLLEALRLHVCLAGPGHLFRRSAQRRAGGWDPRYRFVQDYDFLLRLGLLGGFVRVPEPLATFRVHGGSVTASQRGPAMAREHIQVVEEFLARPDLPPEVEAVSLEALRAAHIEAGLVMDGAPNLPWERFQVLDRVAGPASATLAPRPRGGGPQAVLEWLHREVAQRDAEIVRLHREVAQRDGEIVRLHREVAARDAQIAGLPR
jgi:GT2 family glycosyltransferase